MRFAAPALLLFSALLLLPGLERERAFENTDARYLTVARGMVESGDWLVPRIGSRPHLDKPPLSYWAGALGLAALGPTPFAGRLLAEIAVMATALLLARQGRRWCSEGDALLAALLLLSSSLLYVTSRGLQTDVFQLLFFTAAMMAFLIGVEGRGRPAWLVAAFAWLGLSMNVKGPIALALALAIWLPFLALARARVRPAGRAIALGLVLFLALGLPWYVGLALHDRAALDYWLNVQLAGRISGAAPEVGHMHGPLYLVGVFPLGLLPWTPLVALALWRLRPREGWRRADPVDLYLMLWGLVPLLFFSLPRSKSAQYLLPAFPGLALVVARALQGGRLEDLRARRATALCAALAAVLAGATGLLLAEPSLLRTGKIESALLGTTPLHVAVLFGASAALLGVALRAARGGPPRRAILATALGSGLVLAVGFHALAPALLSWRDEGEIARSVEGAELIEYGPHRVSMLFYFGHPSRFTRLPGPGDADAEEGRTRAIALLRRDIPTFCLAREGSEAELGAETRSLPVWRRDRTVLLANPAAERLLHEPSITLPASR